jgi:hypothetical protein
LTAQAPDELQAFIGSNATGYDQQDALVLQHFDESLIKVFRIRL